MAKRKSKKPKQRSQSRNTSPGSSMARKVQDNNAPALIGAGVGYILRLKRFVWDISGIFLLATASLTLLAFIGLTSGAWLTPWAIFLRRWLGWGSILLVFYLAGAGLLLMRRREHPFPSSQWGRVIALEISGCAVLALLALIGGNSLERAISGLDGGLIGWGIAEFLSIIFSSLPPFFATGLSGLILFVCFILGVIYGLGFLGRIIKSLRRNLARDAVSNHKPIDHQASAGVGVMPSYKENKPALPRKKATPRPEEYRKKFQVEEKQDAGVIIDMQRDEKLPSLDLLMGGSEIKPDERFINQSAALIEKTLAEFGIPAKVIGFKLGPTVTQFAVQPGYLDKGNSEGEEIKHKVRVGQISSLQKDLTLALSAERLRIQAPVPGRPYIGIEVPNKQSTLVRLRPILETDIFYQLGSPLAIALGRDVSGQPLVADLGLMPHLLIAGTTGSGKSVCIQALAICLAMNNSPKDLRFVMIDPKKVEMVRFNGLPHLFGKVETDLERIAGVLRWVVVEMEGRYRLLEELRARDIDSYNRKVNRRKDHDTLPRVVVMIDELADLMMSAADTTETTLVRLAQMARAVGIHLVVATQRPSTDVVTGLIKANFPSRLSFSVASGIDSRVILDSAGAETLLGRGDMLFVGHDGGTPLRAQGVMVSDQEIENVINYWQRSWQTADFAQEEEIQAPWEEMVKRDADSVNRDDLVEKAIEIIRETRSGSTSLLQRRLRIGYPRAARLVDELEDLGILGPSRGGGREREIMIELDERY